MLALALVRRRQLRSSMTLPESIISGGPWAGLGARDGTTAAT